MSLKRTLLVARKTLIETFRDPILLILVLGLPAFFMLICYFGYGTAPKAATYPVLVLSETSKADSLLNRLASLSYEDGRPVFEFSTIASKAEAEDALNDKKAAALLTLEENADGKVDYVIRGDAINMNFIKASAQLEASIIPWLEEQQGKSRHFSLVYTPLDRHRPVSEFDAYVPGMMVFAILLIIPQTAMLIGRERRNRTLQRLNLSLLDQADFLGGICLSQMVVAAIQIVLMFAMAILLGFHNNGSLALALLIGLSIAFGSIGMGILLGFFIKNDTDALNTGSAISMVQVFISGAFFMMPSPILFAMGKYPVGAFDFIPATDGMLALQQVLCGGAAFGDVWFRICATLLLSLAIFGAGVVFYSWKARKANF